jgi:hypothetical protein
MIAAIPPNITINTSIFWKNLWFLEMFGLGDLWRVEIDLMFFTLSSVRD